MIEFRPWPEFKQFASELFWLRVTWIWLMLPVVRCLLPLRCLCASAFRLASRPNFSAGIIISAIAAGVSLVLSLDWLRCFFRLIDWAGSLVCGCPLILILYALRALWTTDSELVLCFHLITRVLMPLPHFTYVSCPILFCPMPHSRVSHGIFSCLILLRPTSHSPRQMIMARSPLSHASFWLIALLLSLVCTTSLVYCCTVIPSLCFACFIGHVCTDSELVLCFHLIARLLLTAVPARWSWGCWCPVILSMSIVSLRVCRRRSVSLVLSIDWLRCFFRLIDCTASWSRAYASRAWLTTDSVSSASIFRLVCLMSSVPARWSWACVAYTDSAHVPMSIVSLSVCCSLPVGLERVLLSADSRHEHRSSRCVS